MQQRYTPRVGRIPIRVLRPRQPDAQWPAKAFVGEVVPFTATIFIDGRDALGAEVLLIAPDGTQRAQRMSEVAAGTDRWLAEILLDVEGLWRFSVRAWTDDWATWCDAAIVKIPAGVDVELTLRTGAMLLERAGNDPVVQRAAKVLASPAGSPELRLATALDTDVTRRMLERPLQSHVTESEPLPVRVDRERAGVGSWYEFFPRSEGARRKRDGTWVSGTFRTAARRLPALAALGFDVVYLPPIHPIGSTNRKGRNNSLLAEPNDPGSPWAIGSAAGGHDAIHPDLGDVDDFTAFVEAAHKNGIEVALDLALQCSPDHPWVTEHPEWFTRLADGSIAHAENPPKKYEDIYPLNFDNDPEGIRAEILRVLTHWIGLGVNVFRVDNPHTKPVQFWEWLLHEVHREHPQVVFLAEAFTRPAMMNALAQVGFHQSYTYFTWRNTKQELADYLSELSTQTSDFLRPNLFVNTPDILTEYLQFGGRAAYLIRAAIAATASPTWGVYAGFELIENVARPGSEENIDNEKYEYRPREWEAAERDGRSIAPYLGLLNSIRRDHPALRQLRNLRVHWSDDDAILVYSKYLDGRFIDGNGGGSDAVIVVANLDPHAVRTTTVHLDLTAIGLPAGSTFPVTDLVTGEQYRWSEHNYVRLDPFEQPVHILRVDFSGSVLPDEQAGAVSTAASKNEKGIG